MKTVLVTGANGQLGKTLQFLHCNTSININYVFCDKEALDITNYEQLKSFFQLKKFTHCINCAAYTNVDKAEIEKSKALEVNEIGVKNLVKVCNAFNAHLLHISTDYVFDGSMGRPYKTNDAPNPINFYGQSKWLGEQAILQQSKKYHIIRTSWLYSPYEDNFLDFVIKRMKEYESLTITTESKGSPTSSIDLAEFLQFIIEKSTVPYGVYHFSAQGETTWYDFAKEIQKLIGLNSPRIIPVSSYKTLAERPKYSVLDITKTQDHYSKIFSWKVQLKRTIALKSKQ